MSLHLGLKDEGCSSNDHNACIRTNTFRVFSTCIHTYLCTKKRPPPCGDKKLPSTMAIRKGQSLSFLRLVHNNINTNCSTPLPGSIKRLRRAWVCNLTLLRKRFCVEFSTPAWVCMQRNSRGSTRSLVQWIYHIALNILTRNSRNRISMSK